MRTLTSTFVVTSSVRLRLVILDNGPRLLASCDTALTGQSSAVFRHHLTPKDDVYCGENYTDVIDKVITVYDNDMDGDTHW